MVDPSNLKYHKEKQQERISDLLRLYGKIAAWGVLALVVLSIIFPTFACGCARANARRYACQSNMKQLGLALAQYAQDSDGELPPVAQPLNVTWREAVYPYVKATGVYQCPDDPSDYSHESPENLPHSYGANIAGWKKLQSANASITLVDMNSYAGPEWNIVSPAFLPASGRELYAHIPDHAFYQHPMGTINCLFVDGHVKALYPMTTLTPVNFWTRDNAPFSGQDLTNAQAMLKHAEEE